MATDNSSLLFRGSRFAAVGGFISGLITLAGQLLIGRIYSGQQAKILVEQMAANSGYLGSAAIGAAATILALMLTLLSLGNSAAKDFEADFYIKIKQIARLNILLLISGAILLQVIIIPIIESSNNNSQWYTVLYYGHLGFTAIIVGLLVAVVLMLYSTVTTLINFFKPSASK